MNKLDLESIREILTSNLPWSPLDFIRGTSQEGDRKLFVDTLTGEIPEGNDLRLIHKGNGVTLGVFCERLPWDSEFFGYDVAKLWGVFPLEPPDHRFDLDYSSAIEALLKLARKQGIRYLFATTDPRDLPTLRALGGAGFSLIETRAYYHMDVTNYSYERRFDVRNATTADIPSLGQAAQIMVNPFDRFHADPFIKREDADRLMYKWVEASISEGFADVTIVPNAPNPTAFCTVKFHRDKWVTWGKKIAQPVFSAVSPEFGGWYRKIISEINFYLKDQAGAEHSFLATQITNKAVIRVWESLGYRYGKGEHIFRILL